MYLDPEAAVKVHGVAGFEPGAGRDEEAQARWPAIRRRMSNEVTKHERHPREDARVKSASVGGKLLRNERVPQDQGGSLEQERQDKMAQAVRVRQRNGRDQGVGGLDSHALDDVRGVVQ